MEELIAKYIEENLKVSVEFDSKNIGGEYGYLQKTVTVALSLNGKVINESSTVIDE